MDWYIQVLNQLIMVYILYKGSHYFNGQWKLPYNNACLHIAQCIWDFLTSHGMEVIHHTPYIPDLAFCDFFLFSTSKRGLKCCYFESIQAVLGLQKLLSNYWHEIHFNAYFFINGKGVG